MSKLPDLVDLVVLARVLERGSFARAALDVGVPPSTLSRKVAALEKRLGVRLLERTTRSLRPTELGEMLAERGRRVREELEGAERVVADHQRAPRGLLRLSVPTPVADNFLAPAIADYLARYPEMRIEIQAEDRYVDLVTEGFDAAVRIGKLRDSSLGTIRLAEVRPVLAAAARYLDRAPPLRHPHELADHAVIEFGKKRRTTWTFVGRGGATETVALTPRAVASSAPLVAELAASGAGLALIPRFVAAAAKLAVLEPGGYRPVAYALSVVTPSARLASPKVRAFVDVLREYVGARTDMFDAIFPRSPRS